MLYTYTRTHRHPINNSELRTSGLPPPHPVPFNVRTAKSRLAVVGVRRSDANACRAYYITLLLYKEDVDIAVLVYIICTYIYILYLKCAHESRRKTYEIVMH